MAVHYFQTANTHPALPFGNVSAGGGAGTDASPYSSLSQIATSLDAGHTCRLHPACYWASPTHADWSSVDPAGGAVLERWDVAGYEGWFPTIESTFFPSSWTPVGGGTGRWTATVAGVVASNHDAVICYGGRVAQDCRGLEFRPAITRCRQVVPITAASIPGDYRTSTNGSDTLVTVYTGSDSVNPTDYFSGWAVCMPQSTYSRVLAAPTTKRITVSDLQLAGGGIRAQPGAGQTTEDVRFNRLRVIGNPYMCVDHDPTSNTGLIQRWVFDQPYWDACTPIEEDPGQGYNVSIGTHAGYSAQAKTRDVQILDPKIIGFSHAQIQALTVPGDTALVDGDFSWPRNIQILKTRDIAGYNELTCGRGYKRGVNLCGHGWVMDRQHIIGQSTVSQFSGRGVAIMPKWSGGYHTEASEGNYGGGSAFSFQHQDGGCQVESILMLSPVFDEVPNFPVRTPQGESGTIPDGALRIIGATVSSIDTYTPRYRTGEDSNVTWTDIPPFAGGRPFTGGVTGKGVDIYVSDSVFLIPEGETVIAAVQSTNETGTSPASWAKRYTADTENAWYTRNQAFNSRSAAGFNVDLTWAGTKRPALPKRAR